jgi:predicted RNase H-like nuclease
VFEKHTTWRTLGVTDARCAVDADVAKAADAGPLAGIDGCRLGWVMAILEATSQIVFRVVPSFAEVVEAVERQWLQRAVIDIPIGLTDVVARRVDGEARRLLRERGVCVFPAPYRTMLAAKSYEDAGDIREAIDDKRVSRQGYEIMPKISEVDSLMTPALQERIREGHPEVTFCRLAGGAVAESKKTAAGRTKRLELLSAVFCPRSGDFAPPLRLPGAQPDDVVDALAMLASAIRWATGREEVIPVVAETDTKGLRAEMLA